MHLPFNLPPASNVTIQMPHNYTCKMVSILGNDFPMIKDMVDKNTPSGNGYFPLDDWYYDLSNRCTYRMAEKARCECP